MNWITLLGQAIGRWLLTLAGRGAPPRPQPPAPGPVPAPAPDPAGEFLAALNAIRAANGRSPCRLSSTLSATSQRHAAWMEQHRTLSHDEYGVTPFDRMAAAGYHFTRAAENIALAPGYAPAQAASLWMTDAGHAANMLGSYAEVGFGAAGGYCCADFGTPYSVRADESRGYTVNCPGGLRGDQPRATP